MLGERQTMAASPAPPTKSTRVTRSVARSRLATNGREADRDGRLLALLHEVGAADVTDIVGRLPDTVRAGTLGVDDLATEDQRWDDADAHLASHAPGCAPGCGGRSRRSGESPAAGEGRSCRQSGARMDPGGTRRCCRCRCRQSQSRRGTRGERRSWCVVRVCIVCFVWQGKISSPRSPAFYISRPSMVTLFSRSHTLSPRGFSSPGLALRSTPSDVFSFAVEVRRVDGGVVASCGRWDAPK